MSFEIPDPVAAALDPGKTSSKASQAADRTLWRGLALLLAICLIASALGYYDATHRAPIAAGVTLTLRVPAGCDIPAAGSTTLVITVRTAPDGTAITGCRLERPALMWRVPA